MNTLLSIIGMISLFLLAGLFVWSRERPERRPVIAKPTVTFESDESRQVRRADERRVRKRRQKRRRKQWIGRKQVTLSNRSHHRRDGW